LFVWLVGCVFVHLHFGPSWPVFYETWYGRNNDPCRSVIFLALYEVHINLLHTDHDRANINM
jgi:hypothetical protein